MLVEEKKCDFPCIFDIEGENIWLVLCYCHFVNFRCLFYDNEKSLFFIFRFVRIVR